MKTKLMFTGFDWAGAGTGFSEEMRHIGYRLAQTNKYEIYWVGVNYVGLDLNLPDTTFSDIPSKGSIIKTLSGVGPIQSYGFDAFARVYNKYAPDLTITLGDPRQFEPYVNERKRFDGIRFPYMAYSTLDGTPVYQPWKDIFNYTNVNMAMTSWATREFQKAGMNFSGYIHHGINWEFFSTNDVTKKAIRNNFGISDDTTLFISWDVNQHRKRIDALLDCWKAFKPEGKKAKLFLYMDSDCHIGWNLERLIHQKGIPRETILFPEDVYGRRKIWEQAEPIDFHRTIASMGDIYLSTTSGEGFGKCLLEAMSLGMPVIVTDYSACSEVCEKGSILIPPYPGHAGRFRWHDELRKVEGAIVDQEKFVEAMLRLYDNPAERKELGAIGRIWAKNFDYDTQVVPDWLDVLDRINPDTILAEEILRI
jgi:glycosyltransferase involved in cell wall biosynthesis